MTQTIEEQLNGSGAAAAEFQEIPQQQPEQRGIGIDLSVLKTETGEGSVEDYLEHTLNFNSSKGMARVLRGLTGMMGSLNFALVDIVVGTLDLMKSSKPKGINNHDDISTRGGIS